MAALMPRRDDPRAVRVTLERAAAGPDSTPLVVAPAGPDELSGGELPGGELPGGEPGSEPGTVAGAGPRSEPGTAWLINGEPVSARLERHDRVHATLHQAGQAPVAVLLLSGRPAGSAGALALELVVDGWLVEVLVESAGRAALRDRARRGPVAEAAPRRSEVRAMIPGRVASVAVTTGQLIAADDPLLVVEAMKMQNELRAPRGGLIGRVIVQPGQTVEAGDLLVVIE